MAVDFMVRCLDSYNKDDWQEAQFGLLLRLDEFLTENGIEYSLDFGSMIGAVRHRGYIPWDNDVDITMHLGEYDKLVELAKAGKLPDGLVLASNETLENYQTGFGRILDTKQAAMFAHLGWEDEIIGVFIDIFLLRPLPNDPDERLEAIVDYDVYDEGICELGRRHGHRPELFIERYREFKEQEKALGHKEAVAWAKAKADAHNIDDAEWYFIGSAGTYLCYEIRKREWVESTVRMPVNGHMLPVFTGYLEILRGDYGDSWRYKPTEDADFVPYNAALHLPAKVFVDQTWIAYPQEKALKSLKAYKNAQMEDAFIRYKYSPDIYAMKGLFSLAGVRDDAQAAGIDLDTMMDRLPEGDLEFAEKVFGIFAKYRSTQRSERYRYWRVAIPIENEWLLAALWAPLLVRKDYWEVAQIVRMTNDYSKDAESLAADPRYRRLEELLSEISEMHLEMDKGNVAAARGHFDRVVEICPAAYEARIGRIWLAANEEGEASTDDFASDLEHCRENGEYLAYYADLLDKLGRSDEARTMREEALTKTTNCMVLLNVQDKMEVQHGA